MYSLFILSIVFFKIIYFLQFLYLFYYKVINLLLVEDLNDIFNFYIIFDINSILRVECGDGFEILLFNF